MRYREVTRGNCDEPARVIRLVRMRALLDCNCCRPRMGDNYQRRARHGPQKPKYKDHRRSA